MHLKKHMWEGPIEIIFLLFGLHNIYLLLTWFVKINSFLYDAWIIVRMFYFFILVRVNFSKYYVTQKHIMLYLYTRIHTSGFH